jgi:hypothetical protein
MRSFDPRRVGSLECRAWETYYRRKWGAFLGDLYAYTYAADPANPLLAEERALLVRSYAALLAAVHR